MYLLDLSNYEKYNDNKNSHPTPSPKEVVVILPYVNRKVLMQLRDVKEGINFPGCWGFFGGSIDEGETPEDASWRELFEEIGYKPSVMYKMGFDVVRDLGNLSIHAYCCPLTIPIEKIDLQEGMDLGLFSLEEIMTKELYSSKMERTLPVIETPYLVDTIKKLDLYFKL
ncbi:MAG: ADP-ribose pyrophosphatase [Candidatus Brocadiaceae bacterium]|nr:ADP-ribose pyrophosphatase [Candidatus Brocadiaceae bacterium]